MIVDGYHGTTLPQAENIVINGMREGRRKGLWLGIGRYFFQDGPSLALHWANREIDRRQLTDKPAVVHVRIDISHCIDLTDNVYWARIREIYSDMHEKLSSEGIWQLGFDANFRNLSDQEQEMLGWNRVDSLVMTAARQSFLRDYRDLHGFEITTLRAAFGEGQPVYPSSWMFDESNVTVCVVDPSALVSPLRIVTGPGW